jgi:hypothetical protein
MLAGRPSAMRSSAIYAADPDAAYDRERQREIDDRT